MRVTFTGKLSLQIEDEWLYEGRSVPVVLKAEVDDPALAFEDGRTRIRIDVPVDLKISEREWSRAVGEVIARHLRAGDLV